MKKFSTSLNGYNKEEVNNFVRVVAKEYESMLDNLKEANEQNKILLDEIEKYKDMRAEFNKAILAAEDAASRMRKMSQEESKMIIDDAKKNASRIVNEALIKADRIDSDSEELRRRTEILKRKIRQSIETELEAIEHIGEDY